MWISQYIFYCDSGQRKNQEIAIMFIVLNFCLTNIIQHRLQELRQRVAGDKKVLVLLLVT
ncbi:hypothetical protein C3374_22825 [Pantoea sp. PSNIH4]|nr:hypothetical protein PSNIH2_05975 [Pantoea sp. PSNIH2]POU40745.1 hypothetical protein C3380_23120 [Pantoea sp. PSNIH5]POU59043.1 hypothetical protein C3374_22825 [Pantoea sp. PSNIH4]POY65451.1 hypothetical protein C3402_23405 [Pantoea sp. PSNIH3]